MKYALIIITLGMIFQSASKRAEAQSEKDWPNLKRYQEANAKLTIPDRQHQRVVFLGNSITDAWTDRSPQFFENPDYVGRGISGQTTPQMLVRFRQDVIDLKPKAVVILAGTNDIAGNTGPSTLDMIMDNFISMTELAKQNGINVFLCSVLPASHYSWSPDKEPADKIISLNKLIKEYAKQADVTYVDYFSALVNNEKGMKKKYSPDGVHPNKAGYKIMEPIIENALNKFLN